MKPRTARTTAVPTIAVILLLGLAAHAHGAGLAIIVSDEADTELVGVPVTVRDTEGNQLAFAITDSFGSVLFESLPAGPVWYEIRWAGYEGLQQRVQIEAGEIMLSLPELRRNDFGILAAALVPTDKVEFRGVRDADVSDQDETGTSRFCANSTAFDQFFYGDITEDGILAHYRVLPVPAPSSCVMNTTGDVAYLGSIAENWIRRYVRVGSEFEPSGPDFLLPGQGLVHLWLSPDDALLQVAQTDLVVVLDVTESAFSVVHSFPLESAQQTTALSNGVGFATAGDGAFTFSQSVNDLPVRIAELEDARHIVPIADRGPLVQSPSGFSLVLNDGALAVIRGVTSRPNAIDHVGGNAHFDGTPGSQQIFVYADGNAALLGRMIVLPWHYLYSADPKKEQPDDLEGAVEVHFSEMALRDFELTSRLPAPENLAVNSSGIVLATFPFQDALVAFKADLGSRCQPGSTRACTLGDRFELEVDWRDFQGNTGPGQVVPGGSEDSEIFTFFDEDNWEMLVKTLDGCGVNGHFWVLSAATTDVEFTLHVTDTETGATREYTNPLGQAAEANVDIEAFPCEEGSKNLQVRAAKGISPAASSPVTPTTPGLTCSDTDTALCLNASRFKIEVEWRDFEDNHGSGQVVPLRSADSGLLWFFDADNWEMLVKVLDGCGVNGSFWVFSAATTNVDFTLRVTDTSSGEIREYHNALGQAAPAITDTEAFSCSP